MDSSRRHRAAALALTAAVGPAACFGSAPRYPDRIASRIRVLGQVVDGTGKPVPEARVTIRANAPGQCEGRRRALARSSPIVDPGGRFVETLYFYSLVRAGACVAVRADPPPDVGMSPDSVTRLDAVFFEGGAVDTVRVRLVLRPR